MYNVHCEGKINTELDKLYGKLYPTSGIDYTDNISNASLINFYILYNYNAKLCLAALYSTHKNTHS